MKKALVILAVLAFQHTASANPVTLISTESTYISNFSNDGDTNFDGVDLLIDEGSGATRALIGFSGLFGAGMGQIPLGSTINSAELTVNTTSNPTANTVGVHQTITGWDQTTVTWNSFNSGGMAGTDYVAAAATTFMPATANTTYDMIDITSIVQNWSNGDANNGIILISDGTDGGLLHDDSSVGLGPSVTVNFTAIPEPTSFLMLGLIGLCFGGSRWWKTRKDSK